MYSMATVKKFQVKQITSMHFSYRIVACIWGLLAVVTNSENGIFGFASYTWRRNRLQANVDHLAIPEKMFLMKL